MIQQLLTISMFPLLIASTFTQLTVEDIEKIKNYHEHYEVIGATSGENITSSWYAEDEVIKTHIILTSSIKEVLANEGIDPSQVEILLYYDPIAIRDDSPPRMWNSKSHPNTITSPWLDLTKTITTSGEEKIIIRIDATAARVMSDLFSDSKNQHNTSSFLSILSIKEKCFLQIANEYKQAISEQREMKPCITNCVPSELVIPLISLFKSSRRGTGSFVNPAINELNYYCQNSVRKYYQELYSNLAIKALRISEKELEHDIQWWKETSESIALIQQCK